MSWKMTLKKLHRLQNRDKEMENMTDNENMEDRMRKLNIYIITVPEQMNGGEAIFKELRIFQN